jgi:SecD/SecF fusion protein
MLFGVFIGTFSSIFIAAPMLILFHLRDTPKPAEEGAGQQLPAK